MKNETLQQSPQNNKSLHSTVCESCELKLFSLSITVFKSFCQKILAHKTQFLTNLEAIISTDFITSLQETFVAIYLESKLIF